MIPEPDFPTLWQAVRTAQDIAGIVSTHAERQVMKDSLRGAVVDAEPPPPPPPPPTLLGGPSIAEATSWLYGSDGSLNLHEAPPDVDPRWDWSTRTKIGPAFGSPAVDGGTYNWHNVRTQIIPILGSTNPTGLRVHVGAPVVHHLEAGTWVDYSLDEAAAAAKVTDLIGGYWPNRAPFQRPHRFTAGQVRRELPENGGGWSVDLDPCLLPDGTCGPYSIVHWGWDGYNPRPHLNDSDQVALWCPMRLISDDPALDLAAAGFVANFSGDLYNGPTVGVAASGVNPGLANPRFLQLGPEWRLVGVVTGSLEEIAAYPTS